MSRSLKKGTFTHPSIFKKIGRLRQGDRTPVKTWSRSSMITPEMVGFNMAVHNGKNFIEFLVTEEHVGHRLGEFSPTRKFVRHGGRMAKEEESAATKPGATGPVKESK